MTRTPCKPNVGLSEHEQNKAGRAELLATSFATFEHKSATQLGRALGGGGFDPARDIEAITVNRWPHGYAPEYNPLFDPDGPEEQRAERDRPREVRQDRHRQFRCGRSGLHGFGDAAGGPRGQRVAERVARYMAALACGPRPRPRAPGTRAACRRPARARGGHRGGIYRSLGRAASGSAGRDVVVLEAADVGDRASGLNGGQVIPGVKQDPDTLEELFGPIVGARLVDDRCSRSGCRLRAHPEIRNCLCRNPHGLDSTRHFPCGARGDHRAGGPVAPSRGGCRAVVGARDRAPDRFPAL